VNAGKQMLSFAKHHGRECQMQFVDCTSCEILSNRADASANSNVLALSGSFGLLECGLRPFGDEEEREVLTEHK
jgi:hypothetical protein